MGGIGIGISPAFGGYAQTYKDKVLGTVPDDLIAYWTLAETSGSTADNAEGRQHGRQRRGHSRERWNLHRRHPEQLHGTRWATGRALGRRQ
jgi:hypothetical protein